MSDRSRYCNKQQSLVLKCNVLLTHLSLTSSSCGLCSFIIISHINYYSCWMALSLKQTYCVGVLAETSEFVISFEKTQDCKWKRLFSK